MFRPLINTLVAASILFAPAANAAMPIVAEPGQIIYRYKTDPATAQQPNQPQTKDITAFYVGVVGRDFSETLPMKAEWQDDDWKVVNGTLPDGILFDPQTKTFSGIPTTLQMGTVVELEGFDENGISVATASASFDIHAIQGIPVEVDFYAHTGKYRYETLPIPAGLTIDYWEYVYTPPPGIEVNGPFYEGTPTTEGYTRLLILGRNYEKKVVATFYGGYTVEDGPSFAHIPDNVKPLPQLEGGSWGLGYNFGAPSPFKVQRLIDPSRPAAYFLELDTGEELPGSVKSNGLSKNLNLQGYVRLPYDTARIRFVAEDSDGTRGESNWFTFGSSDPQPKCNPYYTGLPLTVKTGVASKISIPRPWGQQGVVSFAMASGVLPQGLTLNTTSGRIEGTPLLSGEKTEFTVRVDVTNGSNVVSTNCAYKTEVIPGTTKLVDKTPKQERHIRVGDVYTGTLAITGGIPNYSTDFVNAADWPTLAITTPTQNAPEITVSGPVNEAGNHVVPFRLSNGDTSTMDGRLNINAHGPLDTGEVPTIVVKRLAKAQVWGKVPFDQTTVIPDVSLPSKFPEFTVDTQLSANGSPAGISIVAGDFFGATAAKEGTYGPLTTTMSDFSGQTKTSNTFNIIVEPRDEIAISGTSSPRFVVEMDSEQKATPVGYIQPPGAENFTVEWTLNDLSGNGLPSWVSFNRTSGEFTASANIPHAEINKPYGPFTITVEDSEGSKATSAEFTVSAVDWPEPKAFDVSPFRSNVTGNLSRSETQTRIDIANLSRYIDKDTVIGGISAVTFVSAEPASPAGLTFDPVAGSISGVPTGQFNGDVVVTFEDARSRTGTITIPLQVLPYPSIEMNGASFDLPRLSAPNEATPPLLAKPVSGFWNPPRFEWDPTSTPLPDGVTVSSGGSLVGSSTAAVGTVVSGIRVMSKTTGYDGRTLVSYTPDFSVTISNPKPFTLEYSKDTATFYSLIGDNGLDLEKKAIPTAKPGGSYVKPLTFSLDQATAIADGMTGSIDINPKTGDITGHPDRLGKWTVFVHLKDNEGNSITPPYPMVIKSTLAGNVIPGDGKGGFSGGGEFTLRQDEPFKTAPITLSQVVGTPVFSISPAAPLPSPDFDALTGAFTDNSAFTTSTTGYLIEVDVKDSDDRTFSSNQRPKYRFTVKKPLEISLPPASLQIESRQYSADIDDRIDVALSPDVQHAMGDIRFRLEGDMPGTLVHKNYDDKKNFVSFTYTDANDATQSVTDENLLPLDALVFDTISATLRGIPSKTGTFTDIHIVASDDHMTKYIKDVPNRIKYNEAKSKETLTINVAPANPLIATNVVGGELSDTDTAYQYTTVPGIRSVVENAAYGRPVTWTAVSGTLPQNVTASKGTAVSYTGYPEQLGTFANIVWKARDVVGRTADTSPATITVEPRKPFELATAANPVNLIVNTTDAKVSVTPVFAAYGQPVGLTNWTVTNVANLPPGLTHTVENNRVVFKGIGTVMGTYSGIAVSAVDALGASATISLTFVVGMPEGPIKLEVSDIKTKVGIPFEMQATSSNTYGTVRYYSQDITGDLAGQLDLDGSTGLVSGAFNATGNIDFDVYVTDDTNRVTSKPILVEVMPDLRMTVPQEVQFEPGVAKIRATATDYILGTVEYRAVNAASWPKGITVNKDTGAIEADGTTPLGTYTDLSVEAVDTFTRVGQQYTDRTVSNLFTVKVDASGPFIGLTSATIDPWSKRKENYSFDLADQTKGLLDYRAIGIGEITWDIRSGTGKVFPPGLSLNTNTGLITGKPTQSGDFEFDVRARWKSNSNVFSLATYKMSIDLQKSTLELQPGTLDDAEALKPYSFDLKPLLKRDFIPDNQISWRLFNANTQVPMPSGLYISNGVLMGTPSFGGDTYDIRIRATFDDNNPTAENFQTELVYQLKVKKAAPKSNATLPDRTFSTRQSVTITPTFINKHAADVYDIPNAGSYPAGLFYDGGPIAPGDKAYGLVINKDTGQITGATRVSGTFNVVIRATDNVGQIGLTNSFKLTIVDNVPTVLGSFNDLVDVEPGTTVYSNPILVSGNAAVANLSLEKTTPGIVSAWGRVCGLAAALSYCSGVSSFSTTSTAGSGSYVVLQMIVPSAFDTSYTLTLDVSGEKRTFTVKTRKSITDPTTFDNFESVDDAELSALYHSSISKVSGITDRAPIKVELISGTATPYVFTCSAEMGTTGFCGVSSRSIDSLTVNTANKFITNGQTIQVRAQTGTAYDETSVIRVTVGTVSRDFVVKTKALDITPDNLGQFESVSDVAPSRVIPSNTLKIEGLTTATSAAIDLLSPTGSATLYVCTPAAANSGNCYSSGRYNSRIFVGTTTGRVSSGDHIQVTANSDATPGTSVSVRVTIGTEARVYTVTTGSTLSVPSAFADMTEVTPNTLAYSNVIQVNGLPSDSKASLQVVSGTVSTPYAYICTNANYASSQTCNVSGGFKARVSPSSIQNVTDGDYIQMTAITGPAFSETSVIRLEAGGVVRDWKLATRPQSSTPVGLAEFEPRVDVEPGTQVISSGLAVKGILDPASLTIEAVNGSTTTVAGRVCSALYAQSNQCGTISGTSGSAFVRGYNMNGGLIYDGETVYFTSTAPLDFNSTQTFRITIGGVARYFTYTTRASTTAPTSLGEPGTVDNAEPATTVLSRVMKVEGITDNTVMTATVEEGNFPLSDVRLMACANGYETTGDCSTVSSSFRSKTSGGNALQVRVGESVQVSLVAGGYGETRKVRVNVGGVSRVFTVTARGVNTTPVDLDTFNDVTDAKPSTMHATRALQVNGNMDNVVVTTSAEGTTSGDGSYFYVCSSAQVQAGQCALGTGYTSRVVPGGSMTVKHGDFILIRARSSAIAGAAVKMTVNVGGEIRTWNVTTAPAPAP